MSRKCVILQFDMTGEKKSIYQRAGEWGVPFGLYLACAAITSVFADWFAPLSFLFLILFFGTPFVVYYFHVLSNIIYSTFESSKLFWSLGV